MAPYHNHYPCTPQSTPLQPPIILPFPLPLPHQQQLMPPAAIISPPKTDKPQPPPLRKEMISQYSSIDTHLINEEYDPTSPDKNSHPNIHLYLYLRTTKKWTENKVESFMRDIIIYTGWDLPNNPDQHHTNRIKELLHNLRNAAKLWYHDEYETAITRVIKITDNYTFYNIWDRLNIEHR